MSTLTLQQTLRWNGAVLRAGRSTEGRVDMSQHDLEAAADRLDELEREVEALRVIADAAIVWTYCPSAGGYKDGASVEDTCEDLVAAVETYTGLRSPDDWWTEEEMRAAIDAARSKT